jgi:5-methylcytosine-specific restriction enzyme B
MTFIVKISSEETVKQIFKKEVFIHSQITDFESSLNKGSLVFIYLGGDKSKITWSQGLLGVGEIFREPYDKGYDSNPRYFRIDIKPIFILSEAFSPKLTKLDSRLYDIPYVGGKHFRTQAIGQVNEYQAILLLEMFSEYDDKNSLNVILSSYKSRKNDEFYKYDFINYLSQKNQPTTVQSYVKSMEKMFLHLADYGFSIQELWSKDVDTTLLREAAEFIRKESRLTNSKVLNRYTPKSHWNNGWFYSGINNYLDFLGTRPLQINVGYFDTFEFFNSVQKSNLQFVEHLINRFTASLITKPFVILTGLSGSGKTKLAQAFVQWICEHNGGDENGEDKKSDQYVIVPVGADWTNREPLLGYPNALNNSEYILPDSGVLQLMLRAEKNPELPHFLILDEMNLSHVERYFADFLSTMESNDVIPLHSVNDGLPASGIDEDHPVLGKIPSSIQFPKNLFIIGTVNIDETTHMFSPKVLDRANTIEFRISPDEMETFLVEKREPIDMDSLKGQGASMGKAFLNLYENRAQAELDEDTRTVLNDFFRELGKTGAEFGYRTATEIRILLHQLAVIHQSATDQNEAPSAETADAGNTQPTATTTQPSLEYLDIAIMQKMLPKLHGSRNRLVPVLNTLAKLCLDPKIIKEDAEQVAFVADLFKKNAPNTDYNGLKNSGKVRFPMSLEKIIRMHRNAVENGFTSFAEA